MFCIVFETKNSKTKGSMYFYRKHKYWWGLSWSWSYGSWIYNYLLNPHKSCEIESCSWRGVLDTTLYDKVCQWLAAGRWFSPGTPVSSTNKTDRHNATEILLKVALNTITLTQILMPMNKKYFYSNRILCCVFAVILEENYWPLISY